jgi:hypothetical protein
MSFIKTASVILSAISTTVVMSALGANKANALSEVSLPSTIMIKSAHSNLVVDKYGDNPSFADKAHLYSQANPATFTLRPVRSANGSYETQLASRTNLCFTAAGGLNPNMGNGTQAVFSGDCANSLNLRFYDDGTVRIGRNTGMCLTNQGNRYNTLLNKLHFWACDGSPETKWNFVGVGNVNIGISNPYQVVTPSYTPPSRIDSNTKQDQPIPQPKLQEAGVGTAVKAVFLFLVERYNSMYWGTLSKLYVTKLEKSEQYKRTDNWFFTDSALYRSNSNRLACVAKIDRLVRPYGKTFDGPQNYNHTVFEREGNDYNCYILVNTDLANNIKAKRGF